MADYMIHACKDRLWYVKDYLIPSLYKQGISKSNIILWLDEKSEGNLKCFIDSMKFCSEYESDTDGVWHLQDDVIVCEDFKERTEQFDDDIAAGFASTYDSDPYFGTDKEVPSGYVNVKDLWYSFCCIRITKFIAQKFVEWWYKIAINDGEIIRVCINEGKNDDWAFRKFIMNYYPDMIVHNIKPNLVDHIDYLLGGSIINKIRGPRDARALYFEDTDLINKLTNDLS